MARRPVIVSIPIAALLIAGAGAALATGEMETPKTGVTFFWALYDGLTEEYRAELQDAFNAAHDDVEVEIVPIRWEQLHDRLTTSLAGGKPPEISVIGTRWLLEFMALDAVEEVTQYVGEATIDNIAPGAMEAPRRPPPDGAADRRRRPESWLTIRTSPRSSRRPWRNSAPRRCELPPTPMPTA